MLNKNDNFYYYCSLIMLRLYSFDVIFFSINDVVLALDI